VQGAAQGAVGLERMGKSEYACWLDALWLCAIERACMRYFSSLAIVSAMRSRAASDMRA
jgi:hypothetical protein